jgi:hypothetical protein
MGLEIFVVSISTKIPLLTELRKGGRVCDVCDPQGLRRFRGVWNLRGREV